jgi:hypothetical protein
MTSMRALAEAFRKALLASFEKHGAEAIARVAAENPDEYRRIVANMASGLFRPKKAAALGVNVLEGPAL